MRFITIKLFQILLHINHVKQTPWYLRLIFFMKLNFTSDLYVYLYYLNTIILVTERPRFIYLQVCQKSAKKQQKFNLH